LVEFISDIVRDRGNPSTSYQELSEQSNEKKMDEK
jgi:hypothetical protein